MTSAGRLLLVGNFLSGTLAHRHYCEDLADRLEKRGWSIVRTSERFSRVWRLLDMVRVTWSRRRDYDLAIVDVFSGTAFVWAEVVCFELQRLRIPYVLALRGGDLPRFASERPRRVRRLLASATRVTAPSPYLRETMRPFASDIDVVPNAVSTTALPFTRRSCARPRLIWIRSFHAVYNPVLAIEVLAELANDYPALTLTMIGHDKGDGTLERVRAQARTAGVEDQLQIIPGVAKHAIGGFLAEADVFLNTTDVDNTPVSVIEAMAAGLCVVSTSVGGIPYLLHDEADALLVPPRSPSDMAKAVRRLLDDSTLAAQVSQTARDHAIAWDWEPVLDRWEHLCSEVLRDA